MSYEEGQMMQRPTLASSTLRFPHKSRSASGLTGDVLLITKFVAVLVISPTEVTSEKRGKGQRPRHTRRNEQNAHRTETQSGVRVSPAQRYIYTDNMAHAHKNRVREIEWVGTSGKARAEEQPIR